MKKKLLFLSFALMFSLVFSFSNSASANVNIESAYGGDITTSFSKTMLNNAANVAYYAYHEKQQGTYPIGTGFYFADRVKSGGVWDYKRVYTKYYYYNGSYLVGEDIGNMHYGYVGRAGGFTRTMLSSIAGAYQIYSGTSSVKWYASYFDDPKDQQWINYGMNMWDNSSLPSTNSLNTYGFTMGDTIEEEYTEIDTSLFDLLTSEEKKEIEELVLKNSKEIKEKQKKGNSKEK